jgi:putative selenate reductase molybdopterin-binding subunit
MMNEFSIVGNRIPSINAKEKVTGEIKYSGDIQFPNMLWGKVLRSPYPHAKIANLDTSRAGRIPGVKAVITEKDLSSNFRMGFSVLDQPVLAKEKVRFIGEPVVAVAATDFDIAEEAIERIQIEYEELPGIFDPEEAMKPEAIRIHEVDFNIAARRNVIKGDTEKGFREADFIFEDRFTTPPQEHVPIEPESAMVRYDLTGNLIAWLSAHSLFFLRASIAALLGMKEDRVNVITKGVGGDFGGKSQIQLGLICAALTKKAGPGRAVKLLHTREEEFTCSTVRHPAIIELKTGVKKDGTLVAREARYTLNMGAYVATGDFIVQWAGVSFSGVYKTPHLKFTGLSVYTNCPVGGSFRGFGNPQITFAVESQMDMIAEKLGIDPVEFRLKNAIETGDKMATGWQLRSCGLEECLKRAAEAIGWEQKGTLKGKYQGIGIACGNHGTGWKPGFKTRLGISDTDAGACIIKIEGDGTIRVITGELDYGQGAYTVIAQIVAEELGVEVKDIKVTYGETDVIPYGRGPFASRSTMIGGKAAQLAAIDVKRQLFEIASHVLGKEVDLLEIKRGRVFCKGNPEKSISIADLALRGYSFKGGEYIIGKGYFDHDATVPDPETGQGSLSGAFSFFAQAAKVEIDRERGFIKILKFVSVHDCGKAINPLTAEGQIEGGVVQGLGYTLMEGLIWENGQTLNPNMVDYKIPTSLDIPIIEPIFVETYEPIGPFGAKGLAEPALVSVAPAIANAVYDAIGIRINDLPLAPEKIWRAIRKKEGGDKNHR